MGCAAGYLALVVGRRTGVPGMGWTEPGEFNSPAVHNYVVWIYSSKRLADTSTA
jgi:hypothetical protein